MPKNCINLAKTIYKSRGAGLFCTTLYHSLITHGITITTNKSKVVNRSLIVELLEHRLRASDVSADVSIKTDFLFLGKKKNCQSELKKKHNVKCQYNVHILLGMYKNMVENVRQIYVCMFDEMSQKNAVKNLTYFLMSTPIAWCHEFFFQHRLKLDPALSQVVFIRAVVSGFQLMTIIYQYIVLYGCIVWIIIYYLCTIIPSLQIFFCK